MFIHFIILIVTEILKLQCRLQITTIKLLKL